MPRLSAPSKTVAWRFIGSVLLLGALSITVLWPSRPAAMLQPFRDSGVFLYAGWRILAGEVPYLHVWDHKPPVIFYLNAAGQALAGGSRWGVWVLELLFVFTAGLIGYDLFRKTVGPTLGMVTSALWLVSLVLVLDGGNLPEEYALPLIMGCYWIAHRAAGANWPQRQLALVGLLGGLAFLTKQTTIGVSIAIALVLAAGRIKARQFRELLLDLTALATCSLLPALVFIGLYAQQRALASFWDAAFRFNASYVQRPDLWRSLWESVRAPFYALARGQLLGLASVSWGLGIASLYRGTRGQRGAGQNLPPVLLIALVDFPLELALVTLSGRSYRHYFITLLPVISILAAFLLRFMWSEVGPWFRLQAAKVRLSMAALLGVYLAIATSGMIGQYRNYARTLAANRADAIVAYILQHTAPTDQVLIWGSEAALNFATGRRAPGRFVYQSALNVPGYASEPLILEYLAAITEQEPALIVDAVGTGFRQEAFIIQTPAIDSALTQIRARYGVTARIGDWVVYSPGE